MSLPTRNAEALCTLVDTLLCDASVATSDRLRDLCPPGSSGCVPLSFLLGFRCVQALTTSPSALAAALRASTQLCVADDSLSVSRRTLFIPEQLDLTAHTVRACGMPAAWRYEHARVFFSTRGLSLVNKLTVRTKHPRRRAAVAKCGQLSVDAAAGGVVVPREPSGEDKNSDGDDGTLPTPPQPAWLVFATADDANAAAAAFPGPVDGTAAVARVATTDGDKEPLDAPLLVLTLKRDYLAAALAARAPRNAAAPRAPVSPASALAAVAAAPAVTQKADSPKRATTGIITSTAPGDAETCTAANSGGSATVSHAVASVPGDQSPASDGAALRPSQAPAESLPQAVAE